MKKCLLASLLLLLTVGCGADANTLSLEGDIQNDILSAVSTVSGKIVTMDVKEGQPVKKGDVIAVIDSTSQKYTVQQLQATLDMKTAKLEELQAGTRPEQLAQAKAQVNAAKAQLDLLKSGNRTEQIRQAQSAVSVAQDAVGIAQSTYDYTKTQYDDAAALYSSGAASQNDLTTAKYKLDVALQQLQTAQHQRDSAAQQLTLLQKGSTEQSIRAAQANYDAAVAQLDLLKSGSTQQTIAAAQADVTQAKAQLEQAQYVLSCYTITSPVDGILTSKNYELGDVVSNASDIADIAASGDVYVQCYLPDKYLDKVYYGQPLPVQTSLGQQTGKVSYIALKHEYTPKDEQTTADEQHISTRIHITIDAAQGRLKSGMRATVSIPKQ